MIWKAILFFGEPAAIACDEKCNKAWGISSREKNYLSVGDPDDYEFLADHELLIAPEDPGTYEGGHAKPTTPESRLNKWCCRECERCAFVKNKTTDFKLPDYSTRRPNKTDEVRA